MEEVPRGRVTRDPENSESVLLPVLTHYSSGTDGKTGSRSRPVRQPRRRGVSYSRVPSLRCRPRSPVGKGLGPGSAPVVETVTPLRSFRTHSLREDPLTKVALSTPRRSQRQGRGRRGGNPGTPTGWLFDSLLRARQGVAIPSAGPRTVPVRRTGRSDARAHPS